MPCWGAPLWAGNERFSLVSWTLVHAGWGETRPARHGHEAELLFLLRWGTF